MKQVLLGLSLAVAGCLNGCSAFAADSTSSLMARWYQSLEAADAEALGVLLTDDAVITLQDLDISQNKSEFLSSMDDWVDAIEGGSISHKMAEAGNAEADTNEIKVTVCYRFKANEQLNTEAFIVENGQIKSSTQTKIADSCADY
jgi:hypothetical protein